MAALQLLALHHHKRTLHPVQLIFLGSSFKCGYLRFKLLMIEQIPQLDSEIL
jgi:hypothetical protein